MAGNYRDPMVGRDLLIGGLFGLLHSSCIPFGLLLPRWLGFESMPLMATNMLTLGSMRTMLAAFLDNHVVTSVFVGFAYLFFLLLLYIILRREWLAAIALFLISLVIEISAFALSGPRLYWVGSIVISILMTIVVARFGVFATMAAQLFFFLTIFYPQTTNFSIWYAPSTVFVLAIILGLAIYGFYTSLGGRRLFADRLLGEPLRD